MSVQKDAAPEPDELVQDAESHAAVFREIDRGNGEAAAEAMLHVVLDGKNALAKALVELRSAPATTPSGRATATASTAASDKFEPSG